MRTIRVNIELTITEVEAALKLVTETVPRKLAVYFQWEEPRQKRAALITAVGRVESKLHDALKRAEAKAHDDPEDLD